MADGFVSLDSLLRETAAADAAAEIACADVPEAMPPRIACPCAGALAAVRRFHAALADALDFALDGLLRDIACDVLARELALEPADVSAIASRALQRFANDSPLRVRAHPDEIGCLTDSGVPVVADGAMRRGDLAIDLRSGSVDASLGARLLCALESTA